MAVLTARRTQQVSVVAVLALSAMFTAYTAWLYALALTPSAMLFDLYDWVFAVLVATWVVADLKARVQPTPSFDTGWFVFALLPLYVPFHLVTTRGWRRGLLVTAGIAGLLLIPWLAPWCVWALQMLAWVLRWLLWQLDRLAGLIQWAFSSRG